MNHLVVLPVIALMIQTPRNLHVFDYLRGNELAVMKLLPAIWLTAGVCEEIIYRGYLITTVAGLLGGSRVATFVGCVIAAVVFGLAHDYQGLAGMLSTGVVGLMLGTLYIAERRNLWTNIVAHAVGDTISLLAIFASLDRPLDDFARRMSLGL
jgi:membrane protease YdiL (CAAX protease family)